MKLQKLCYIAHGWSLALRREPLFDDEFQAWANGPVCWALFNEHRGKYNVSEWPRGNSANLKRDEKIILDGVLRNYEALNGTQLSTLTHKPGTPWTTTRGRLPAGANSARPIDNELIREHYIEALGV